MGLKPKFLNVTSYQFICCKLIFLGVPRFPRKKFANIGGVILSGKPGAGYPLYLPDLALLQSGSENDIQKRKIGKDAAAIPNAH